MTTTVKSIIFSIACLFSIIIVNSPLNYFSPQIIALFSIISITTYFINKKVLFYPLIFLVQIIVFSSGSLHSPFLFLEYFLLFSLAFYETPKSILIYSLILSVFISQSLFDYTSLIYLFSFMFIAPLAYFVTQNHQENKKLSYDREETLLWLTLELKQHLDNLPPSKETSKIIKHTNDLIKELETDD